MDKIMLVAALAALGACSQAETANTADEGEAAGQIAEAAPMAADGSPPHGRFKVTQADGSVQTEDVREDGTYTAVNADGEITTGTWRQKPGEYCNTLDQEGAVERCHKESIDENGVWISLDPEGEQAIVERIES